MNTNNKKPPTSRLAPHAKPRRAESRTQALRPPQPASVTEEPEIQTVQVSRPTTAVEPVLAHESQPATSTLLGSFAKKNKYAFITVLAVSAILAAAAVVSLL